MTAPPYYFETVLVSYAHIVLDPDPRPAAGTITFHLLYPGSRDPLMPAYDVAVTARPFHGYLGSDGVMRRDSTTGQQGVPILACDNGLGVDSLHYRAEFALTDEFGTEIPRRPIEFQVGLADIDLNTHPYTQL